MSTITDSKTEIVRKVAEWLWLRLNKEDTKGYFPDRLDEHGILIIRQLQ